MFPDADRPVYIVSEEGEAYRWRTWTTWVDCAADHAPWKQGTAPKEDDAAVAARMVCRFMPQRVSAALVQRWQAGERNPRVVAPRTPSAKPPRKRSRRSPDTQTATPCAVPDPPWTATFEELVAAKDAATARGDRAAWRRIVERIVERIELQERIAAEVRRQMARFLGPDPREDARTLGLPWPCTRDQFVAAWRSTARQHHPDHGGDAEKFKTASAARDRLQKLLEVPC